MPPDPLSEIWPRWNGCDQPLPMRSGRMGRELARLAGEALGSQSQANRLVAMTVHPHRSSFQVALLYFSSAQFGTLNRREKAG